jgi:hypothetical protein
MSSPDKFDFKKFVPTEVYRKYFNTIMANESVYICIIQDESQVGAVYLEKPLEDILNIEGIVRVFYNSEDLKQYGKSVSVRENVSMDLIKKWEIPFNNLVEHISKLNLKYKKAGRKGIMAVASTIYDERFIHIDTVWTDDQNLMT